MLNINLALDLRKIKWQIFDKCIYVVLKGQCHKIVNLFFAQKTLFGFIWTCYNAFANFLAFAKIFDYKV